MEQWYKNFLISDIVLKVRQPLESEVGLFKDSGNLISFLYPAQNKDVIDKLAAKKMTAFGNFFSSTALCVRSVTFLKKKFCSHGLCSTYFPSSGLRCP